MSTPARNRRRGVLKGPGGFEPIAALWDSPRERLFPSEQSGRWFIRTHRAALTEAAALAYFRGRLWAHRERFGQVVESTALQAARQRSGEAC